MPLAMEVLFGPPGTGKTTELSRLTRQYVEQEGSDTVVLCSYTRAGARELAGRDLPLGPHQIGTLHALCYHGLDRPTIAEAKYKDWNEAYPEYPISPPQSMAVASLDPGDRPKLFGDECLQMCSVLRNQLMSVTRWSEALLPFWTAWQAWKSAHGYLDFTDLIDRASTVLPVAPGHPRTLIVDEAQDLSLLQWRLIRQWGQHTDRVLAAGDDDQCLYSWSGADFHPLLVAPHKRVLGQSYRVPQSIQAQALRYSEAIKDREPKVWRPRAITGTMRETPGTWETSRQWLSQILTWLEEPWGTAMCIAPCRYMLEPLLLALRQEGIPFSNRWRRPQHEWNPLHPPPRGIGIVRRLCDFLRPADRLWTWQELATWLPLIRSDGVLIRGAKTQVALHAEEPHICTLAQLEAVFQPDSLPGAVQGGLAWFEDHLLQSQAKGAAYPLRVYRRGGIAALREEPRVTIGTAHSVKGAEADHVLFFTDLARAQAQALSEGGPEADNVYRMLYVGATRARETLLLVGPCHA